MMMLFNRHLLLIVAAIEIIITFAILPLFILPLAFFYDIAWWVRCKIVLWMGSSPEKHKERVEHVQQQVLPFTID